MDVTAATNVLDRWINSASHSLVRYVKQEMEVRTNLDNTSLGHGTLTFSKWVAVSPCPSTLGPRPSLPPLQAYRLYTVAPFLVKFIENLTNIYVRFNRKRLKVSVALLFSPLHLDTLRGSSAV